MFLHITKARYIEDYKIYFEFNNGEKGIVDFKGVLKGKVFEPHKDINFFKNFILNPPTIEWSNHTDLAPEFILELVKKESEYAL